MLTPDRPDDLKTFAALASLLLVTGCRATAQTVITLTRAGSGTITVSLALDPQAAARIGPLAPSLRVADLQRAGWVLDPVATAPDGSVTASVHHAFANVAQAQAVLGSLGPVHLSVSHRRHLVSSDLGISGSVDLSNGVDAFGDDALDRALGVPSLSGAMAQLQVAGAVVPDVTLSVVAKFPARPAHLVGGGAVRGGVATWTIPLGQRLLLGASSSSRDPVREEWFVGAFGLLLASVVTAAVQIRRRAGRRRHRDRWTLARM